ncbi:MAG TPA: DUF3488 and transglutaminase-like domain-containing protein [Cellulomonas sp.]
MSTHAADGPATDRATTRPARSDRRRPPRVAGRRPGAVLRRGWRSPAATALLALTTAASLGALSGVLAPGAWGWHVALAVVGTAAVTATVRAFTRSVLLPTTIALVLAAYGLLAWYATPPGGNRLLPDGSTLTWVRTLADQAVDLIESSVVPMTVPVPVELMVATSAVLVFLAADLLAVGCGFPALGGLVLLVVWTPGVLLGYPGSSWALAGTGFGYLVLLALGHPPAAHDRGRRRAGAVLAGSAALVAVTLAAGPVLATVPVWSWVGLPDLGTGAVGPVRLSEDLDLRDSLRTQSSQVVLRYTVEPYSTGTEDEDDDSPTVTAGLVGPLRSFTLRDFDGRSWVQDTDTALSDWEPDALLTSDPSLLGTRLDPALGTLAQVDVEVGALRDQRLPISTAPRTVAIDGDWLYDTARDEIVGEDGTDSSTSYTMVVQVPDLTADLLRAADGDLPEEVQTYLDVPETERSADVQAVAEQITAGATTAYDQALALQTYFRSSAEFRYDTSVADAESDDAVWDFLQSRRGYCVQFATSMTLMARMLGIPARLAVGFLPGELGTDGSYSVTGADAHAWPELYFTGVGWVRFEPTPAVQTGAPPAWSNPLTADTASAAPSEEATRPGTGSSATPTGTSTTAAAGASGSATGGGEHAPVLLAVLGGLLLAALAGAAAVLLRRRRAPATLTPEAAWQRLRTRLARAGIAWSDARTPRQAADTVRTARGRPLSEDAEQALSALVEAIERSRYAPEPGHVPGERLQEWVGTVLRDLGEQSEPDASAG